MKDIFNSHPVSVLKKEISKTNVKKYSKLNKAEVVDLMMKNQDRFSHIKMAVKKERKSRAKQVKAKPVEPKKKEEPKAPKEEKPKVKKERSEKQEANDKRLGELAKQRASKKKEAVAEPGMPPSV